MPNTGNIFNEHAVVSRLEKTLHQERKSLPYYKLPSKFILIHNNFSSFNTHAGVRVKNSVVRKIHYLILASSALFSFILQIA